MDAPEESPTISVVIAVDLAATAISPSVTARGRGTCGDTKDLTRSIAASTSAHSATTDITQLSALREVVPSPIGGKRETARTVARVTVYALNLFDIASREEYLAYSKRSPEEVAKHGGRVVALGQFRESVLGDIEPRTVLILVEWDSKDAFDSYCNDPELADLHAHRENGSSSYVWHLFDRLDDLRPLLKPH